MLTRAEDIIKKSGVEYLTNVDIARLSTIGVHSTAAFVATPKSTDGLLLLVRELYSGGIPHKIVGGMSNVMPRSDFYSGVLINTRKIDRKNVAEASISAECGVSLSHIVRALMQNNLGGMSQLFHIPGTLGGSVRGNAGAHGIEISDVLEWAEVYIPSRDKAVSLTNSEMKFGYRTSRIKSEGGVLLSARLRAVPCDRNLTQTEIKHFRDLRKNQPQGVRTLGSTFKRVDGVSAGYYIDKCGLKGVSVGGALVSDVHAGFIVNRGDATPNDLVTLIDFIKNRVFSEFGILLEEEIDYL